MTADKGNCKKLQNFQKKFSPFKKTNSPDSIKNIVTGIHVSSKVNVHTAITIGSNTLPDILTKSVVDYLFKSRLQAVNKRQFAVQFPAMCCHIMCSILQGILSSSRMAR